MLVCKYQQDMLGVDEWGVKAQTRMRVGVWQMWMRARRVRRVQV